MKDALHLLNDLVFLVQHRKDTSKLLDLSVCAKIIRKFRKCSALPRLAAKLLRYHQLLTARMASLAGTLAEAEKAEGEARLECTRACGASQLCRAVAITAVVSVLMAERIPSLLECMKGWL